jgi:hypothetical protein
MMKKLEISRKEWLRGGPSMKSFLYRPDDGKMCCLGFLGRACGLTVKEMEYSSYPSNVRAYRDNGPSELLDYHEQRLPLSSGQRDEPWEETIGCINDAEDIDDETREAWVIEGFRALLGYDVTFVD